MMHFAHLNAFMQVLIYWMLLKKLCIQIWTPSDAHPPTWTHTPYLSWWYRCLCHKYAVFEKPFVFKLVAFSWIFIWLNYSSCQYKVELWQQTLVKPQLQSLAYGGKRFHYRNKVLWMHFRCDSLFVVFMELSCNPQKDKINMMASESPSNYKLQLWHY